MNPDDSYRVLLVEDNELDARSMTRALTVDGDCHVERVADLSTALDSVHRGAFDCVLLDLSLPDSDGLVSVETMVARSPNCPVVVLTGLDDPDVAIEAVARGAHDYLVKNTMTPELVLRAIRYAVARHSSETELSGVKERLRSMHAREQIARDLHDTVIQRLFAAGMTLEAATRLVSRDAVVERTLGVVDEIDGAIRELRAAIFDLHIAEDDESFAREIAAIAAGHEHGLGFPPVVRLGELPDLPGALRHDVLAVVREALSNVSRHANATTATLTVHVERDRLVVRVTDNGRGPVAGTALDPGTGVHQAHEPGLEGNGLRNLSARAETHGGTMQLDRGPRGGSELSWSVPV